MRLPIRRLIYINSVKRFTNWARNVSFSIDSDETNERTNMLLGENKEFPFNGQVTCEALNPKLITNRVEQPKPPVVYYTLSAASLFSSRVIKDAAYEPDVIKEFCRWNAKIELFAFKCPLILRRELMDLFPNATAIMRSQLTIINFCEIVEEDNVEEENISLREKADSFVLAASSVCATLNSFGHWADFVDPHGNCSRMDGDSYRRLVNQDENYSLTGFKVTDNEGCNIIEKVSMHSSPFIGSVFTTAKIHSRAVSQILNSGD